MKKKLLALFLACVMVLGLLAGCSGSNSNSQNSGSNASGDGTGTGSVYWLNFKSESREEVEAIAASYTEQFGVPVNVLTAGSGTYQQTLTSEMDKSTPPTLFVLNSTADILTWSDYCYDLTGTPVYDELTTDDFTLFDENGKACSIAYCYETFGIIVNKALLAEAGYSVDDITNFDSLKAVADDIHARAGELGFDAFTSAGLDSSSSWRFSGHLANMPLYYESVDDGWTETPAAIKGTYLDNFKAVWDLYITDSAYAPTSLATAGYDAEAEFGKGEAVFYQNGSWEYANLTNNYGMNADDLQMIPLYTGVAGEENQGLCNGTENYWSVNAKAAPEDIQATLDFMYWLVTSEEGTQFMSATFGEIPYKGAAENPNVFFQNANEYIAEGKYSVDWAFSYTPNVEEWRGGVVSAMTQYCAGGSWDDVVTAFVAGWSTQYQAVYG